MLNENTINQESKILVVANQDISYQKICKILTDADYQIYCLWDDSITEETIINEINQHHISLIFLDYQFKNLQLERLCQKIKKNPNYREIPLIILGDSNYSNDKIKAFQLGAVDYLCPPFDQQEILTKVRHYLKLIELEQQLADMTIQLGQIFSSDRLTKLANQRYFIEYLEQEWNRCARERVSLGDGGYTMLSVIFIAVDSLESDYKIYGQKSIEQILIEIAETLKLRLQRPTDLLARYDHNIFGIILPNTDSFGLTKLIEVLFEKIKPFQELNLIKFRLGGVSRIPSRALSSQILIEMGLEALEKAADQEDQPIFIDFEEVDFDQ